MATVGGNYRIQWPSTDATFITYAAYFDYFFEDFSSGLGVLITRDVEGFEGLSNIQGGIQYAYQLPLTEKLTFRAGINAGAIYKTADFSGLIFGDQLNPDGTLNGNPTGEGFGLGNQFWLFDLGTGALLYAENFWFGASVGHINRPNQSLIGGENLLRMKTSVHGGYKIPLRVSQYLVGENNKGLERSITLTAQYKLQGPFMQLESGLYTTLEPMVFGLWYRGIPIPNQTGSFNNDGLIALVGMSHNGFNIGYSFDYTLSNLGIRSGGAHEVSISFDFFLGDPRRPPLNARRIPCPRF